jgi:hypothetical protein
MQSLIADPEVMGDLVVDGLGHAFDQVLGAP